MKKKFRSFEEAREYVSTLKLKSVTDWKKYHRSGNKPYDIPSYPNEHYISKGWKGWGDWLGTNIIATKDITFLNFQDARKYVQSLNLKNRKEWEDFRKSSRKPDNIPTNPNRTYKDKGWKNIHDWLGTGKQSRKEIHEQFLTFDDASGFVKKLKLKSETQWREFLKSKEKPTNIPSDPHTFYKNKGWTNWGDFLGTKNISVKNKKKLYLRFEDAKKIISALKLKNQAEWREFLKSNNFPKDIPKSPEKTYKNEWKGMGDWLGTGILSPKDIHARFLSFKEARMFVRKQELKNQAEWRSFTKSGKLPKNISTVPDQTYKNEWKGLGDWLGTGTLAPITIYGNYLSFGDARKEAQLLAKKYNLKTWNDWNQAVKEGKIPKNLPLKPDRVYSRKNK